MNILTRAKNAITAMSAGWTWKGGVTQSVTGQKIGGSLNYPALWDFDFPSLRARSRVAYWESLQAKSLIGRLRDNAINSGLFLESNPVWSLIDPKNAMNEEARQAWIQNVETRYGLWADSKDPDAAGERTFYQLQDFIFLNRLRDGEVFLVLRYSGDTRKQNPLEIQFLDPDQIQDPFDGAMVTAVKARGNRMKEGIEIDSAGREVAYFVTDKETGKVTRIPKRGNKRLFVIHSALKEGIGQVRGMPVLAMLVHELQKITDFQVAELEAAVINAVIAAWIKPSDKKPASRALSGIVERGSTASAADETYSPKSRDALKPGLLIQSLKEGEELLSYDTKRPNVNFDAFKKSFEASLSASIGIPVEVLNESFNANYSASRASLVLFWHKIEKEREEFGAEILDPIYEAWMQEEIGESRILANGFGTPVLRRAWLNASWIGIPQPSIDPLKEANAARIRIEDGMTTREREAKRYNGSEYRDNVERLTVENPLLAAANKSMQKPKPAAPAEDPEEEQEEDDADDA